MLNGLGYTRVRDFDGGIAEWIAAGLQVEHGSRRVVVEPRVMPAPTTHRAATPEPRSSFLAPFMSTRGLLLTWLLINIVCGLIYWAVSFAPGHGLREQGQPLGHGGAELLEALYFSFVTGLSIGFGDIVPVGAVRILAVLQGGACLLIFGVIISRLVSGRQEELTEEIHRIAFEDRLGRVRTNLHLVVADIQEVAQSCSGGATAPPGIATRIESAAAVFAGELRTIHDLLYRPQATPDEDVLESILAHVEGGLREFRLLMDCLDRSVREAPALVANVGVLANLANEICGECVPREYAPHLKVWMDRIQGHARLLETTSA